MPKSKESHAAFYWGITLVAACVYFGGYAALRLAGALSKHMIGSEGATYVWVSGPIISGGGNWSDRFKESAAPFLEAVFRPLCRDEGEFWTWKYSGEDEELLLTPLPAR